MAPLVLLLLFAAVWFYYRVTHSLTFDDVEALTRLPDCDEGGEG